MSKPQRMRSRRSPRCSAAMIVPTSVTIPVNLAAP
jgi:hypothetical protein